MLSFRRMIRFVLLATPHLVAILSLFLLALIANGQEPAGINDSELRGRVKFISYERTYFVYKRSHVDRLAEQIYLDLYDMDGFKKQSSVFGNGERRTVFERSGKIVNARVMYFDEFGRLLPEESFSPFVNDISELGLCKNYTIKKWNDRKGKVTQITETCADGALRAQETFEFDQRDRDVRYFREDAKSRTWEQISVYDTLDNLVEFRHTVNDTKQPKYTQMVQYVQYKFDEQKNWTEVICSAFDSLHPGELIYQFNERRRVTYFDK
jgi:hypothetical protein